MNWRKAGEAGITMLQEYGIYDDLGTIYNYYSGAASTGEGLIAIYNLTKRQKDKNAVRKITDFIIENAKEDRDGLYWGVDCSMFHNAGTMINLYHAAEFLQDNTVKEVADRVPNFEGGTAGTGYALTVAYQYSKNETYKQAAIEAAKHLKAIAVKQGDGFLIPWHDVPGEKPIFYLANCHGSAGIASTLLQMYQFKKKEIHFIRYIDDPYPTNVTLK